MDCDRGEVTVVTRRVMFVVDRIVEMNLLIQYMYNLIKIRKKSKQSVTPAVTSCASRPYFEYRATRAQEISLPHPPHTQTVREYTRGEFLM